MLAGALVAGIASAGCAPAYEAPAAAEREPALARSAPPAATTAAPKDSGAALVRPLYRDDWFGAVTLVGIDAQRMRAVIRLESQDPPRVAIDTVDLAKGERVDRWEADGERAKRALEGAFFSPLTGSFDVDARRFASMLRDLGPWHLRQPLPSPTFAVTSGREQFLFGARPTDGSDGDWLYAIGKGGQPSRRIDHGLVASYSPVFSPDGDSVAFVGCAASPCDYGLFVTKLGEERPRRVPGIQRATPPMWSSTGDVLAVGGRAQERCLFRVSTSQSAPRSLACVKGLTDVSFAQDPEGRTAAVAGMRGVPGKQSVDVTWLLLADATVLGSHTVERAVGSSVLSASGLMALPMARGAVSAVDLVTGTSTVIHENQGWFFGFEGARWVGDTLVLLRKVEGEKGFQIVAIDVRKASGRRDQPWL